MSCWRDDGSGTSADLGPSLPYHDLAHFVAERHFAIEYGFFGNVRHGYSIEELAEERVIRSLGPDSWKAEVLARAVGSLVSGACSPQQFEELVTCELTQMGLEFEENLEEDIACKLRQELQELISDYDNLADGESQELVFRTNCGSC